MFCWFPAYRMWSWLLWSAVRNYPASAGSAEMWKGWKCDSCLGTPAEGRELDKHGSLYKDLTKWMMFFFFFESRSWIINFSGKLRGFMLLKAAFLQHPGPSPLKHRTSPQTIQNTEPLPLKSPSSWWRCTHAGHFQRLEILRWSAAAEGSGNLSLLLSTNLLMQLAWSIPSEASSVKGASHISTVLNPTSFQLYASTLSTVSHISNFFFAGHKSMP